MLRAHFKLSTWFWNIIPSSWFKRTRGEKTESTSTKGRALNWFLVFNQSMEFSMHRKIAHELCFVLHPIRKEVTCKQKRNKWEDGIVRGGGLVHLFLLHEDHGHLHLLNALYVLEIRTFLHLFNRCNFAKTNETCIFQAFFTSKQKTGLCYVLLKEPKRL